jgi:hypothetical protein
MNLRRALGFGLPGLLIACGGIQPPGDGAFDGGAEAAAEAGLPGDATAGDADPLPPTPIAPRVQGERAPLSANCDPSDPARCLLPWPSNVFTERDATRPTGLRLAVDTRRLIAGVDDPASLARADGFSRVSPVLTVVTGIVDESSLGDGTQGALRLVRATPGTGFGTIVPVRLRAVQSRTAGRPETAVIATVRTPLDAGTDYVAVLMDSVRVTDGPGPTADALARASLGLTPPSTGTEARYAAYHAPSRAALMAAGIDPARVLRVWDFTTRSEDDPVRTLRAMREQTLAAVDAGRYGVVIRTVEIPAAGAIAAVVQGQITGLPDYVDRAAMTLARDADGRVRSTGVHDAPFRVTIPRGTGPYRAILFGHGLGGDYSDDAFDPDIAAVGAAKVGVRFVGLTGGDVIDTIGGLDRAAAGSDWAASLTQQSLADVTAIHRALAGRLGEALAAPTLAGMPNPAAGRTIDTTRQMWAGGSLGGTLGMVYAQLEPTLAAAVLNVPGAGWSGYLALSSVFALGRGILLNTYRSDVNLQLAIAIAQTNFDAMDGANWARAAMARRVPLLVQQSMGDPVLPAPGTEMVATALRARQLGAVLSPVYGVEPATDGAVLDGVGFTQYRVPSNVTGTYDVHGFGARGTVAGLAAREQIFSFIQSVWAGAPRATLPPRCVNNTPANSCDFSSAR